MRKSFDERMANYALLGLLLLIVLFLGVKQGFIGSVYVQCTNFEPESFDEFGVAINDLNGAVISVDPFVIQTSEGLETYPLYRSQSSLGNLYVIPVEGMSCGAFLDRVNANPFYEGNLDVSRRGNLACEPGYAVINNVCQYNVCWPSGDLTIYSTLNSCNDATGYTTTNFMSAERRQILDTEAGYMFCNEADNLAFVAPSIDEFMNYVSTYEVCTPSDPRQDEAGEDDEEDDVVVVPGTVNEDVGEVVSDPDNKSKVYNTVLVLLIMLLAGFLVYRKMIRGKKRR